MKRGADTLVIIPALNEAEGIAAVVGAVAEALPAAEVLVVDDGSTDGTAGIAARAGAGVLVHPFNLGYGAALQTGFLYALASDVAVAALVDADGQHEPRCLPSLVAKVREGADVVVGSRFLEGEAFPLSPAKSAGVRLFRWLASRLTGRRITDATSGFQALSPRALALYAGEDFPADYPDADVLVMAHRAGLRLEEVAVTMYPDRPKSRSMHGGLRPLYYVAKMGLSLLVVMLRPATAPPGGARR